MRLLQVVFVILWSFGYLGNGILFLYIEWSFVRQSFIQVFNPFLQLQILGVLLTTRLFWVFLVMAIGGYYAVTKIERYLEQKKPEIKAARVVSSPLQISKATQSVSSEPSVPNAPTSVLPSQPPTYPASELETGLAEQQIKLLEWAIQSSQKVRFDYEEQYDYLSNCTVTPISLKTIEQALCVEGYSYQRGAKSNYVIKRIRDLKIVPANEPNPELGGAKSTRINLAPVVSPPPPPLKAQPKLPTQSEPTYSAPPPVRRPVSEHKPDISQERIARIDINFPTDELEKIANSEWNNARRLSEIHYELEFRSRKKAVDLRERIAARLTQLQLKNPRLSNQAIDTFTDEEGVLRRYGYKVGINGLSERERWKILDTVFSSPLLQMDNAAYLSEWGEPNSAKRLQKLSNSIAAFTRLAKGRNRGNFSKAIQDWETDLAYLRRAYYNNRFSFQYPRT